MHSICWREPSLSIWTKQASRRVAHRAGRATGPPRGATSAVRVCAGVLCSAAGRGATSAAARAASPNSKCCLSIAGFGAQGLAAVDVRCRNDMWCICASLHAAVAYGTINLARMRQLLSVAAGLIGGRSNYARGFARRLAAPEASAKTGALRRGVQRQEPHRARSRRRTAALRRQGPELHASRPVGVRGVGF